MNFKGSKICFSETSFTKVASEYGVSDNAIKKWCISYGIPHLKKDLKKWYQENKRKKEKNYE